MRRWTLNEDTKQWKVGGGGSQCNEKVDKVVEDGVSDSLTVELTFDTPYLTKGTRTVKELKDLCPLVLRSGRVEAFVDYLKLASYSERDAVQCIDLYNKAIATGLPATTMLPFEGMTQEDPATGAPFAGTFLEARQKFCDKKANVVLAEQAAAEAPYRKVLKEGKLEVALKYKDKQLYGAGRKVINDPKQLLAAKVWFREYSYTDNPCNNRGAYPYFVVRFQFDGKQKLVKESSKQFCGAPPTSAFK